MTAGRDRPTRNCRSEQAPDRHDTRPRDLIDLKQIAATIGEPDEHPLARRVWRTLAMRAWRDSWRKAVEMNDHNGMDYLDRQYEMIQGV